MARKIGDVTIEGDYDGDRALRQAKKNVDDLAKAMEDGSETAGRKSGDAWAENFSKSMRDRMSDVQMPFFDRMADKAGKQGNKSGRLFSDHFGTLVTKNIRNSVDESIRDLARLGEPGGLERLMKRVGSVDGAMQRFQQAIREAAEAGGIHGKQIDDLTASVLKQEEALRAKLITDQKANQAIIDRIKLERDLVKGIHEALGARRNLHAVELEGQLQTLIGADAMEKYSASIREATEESKKMIGPMFDRAAAEKVVVDQIKSSMKANDGNALAMQRAKLQSIGGADALRRHGLVIADTAKKTRSLGSLWSGMSHNGKQWTLIIGAIAAALPTLSVLGSAAGGALAVVGNSAVTLVAGIALAVVGFKGLFDESVKLTEGAVASRDAFKDLGQAFKDLQPGIVNAMFDSMAASIENLTANLLPGIEGNLNALSAAVGGAMSTLLDMFASPEAISIFNGLLETASKTIGPLLEGIGGLFLGILAVFEQASPLAESFAGWLQQIGTDFLGWTQSDAGRERIAEWLETAERILPLVGQLLVGAGQALANLVTPSSITNAENFLSSITDFMEPLSGLLDILGELDVFGVLAELLQTVGEALAPLQEPMKELAGLIGTTLKGAIDTLGPAFGALAGFLAPIISAVVDFLTPIFERLANDVLPVLVEAWGKIMEALAPVGAAIQGLVDALQPVVSFLIDVLMNAFNLVFPAIQFVVELVVGIITGLINGLTNVFSGITMIVENWGSDWGAVWEGVWLVIKGVVEFIWNLISVTLIGRAFGLAKTALTALKGFFTSIWTGIQNVVKSAITNVNSVITNVMGVIRSIWSTIWNGIKTTVTTIWNGIKTVISTVFNAVKSVITTVINTIKTLWSNAWNYVQTTVSIVWNGIKSVITTVFNAVWSVIKTVLGTIKGVWSSVWGAIKTTATTIWGAIRGAIKSAIDGVKSVISNVLDTIKGIWKTVWDGLKSTAQSVWDGIKSVIKTPIDAIVGFINSLRGPIDAAIGWFNNLFGAANNAQNKSSSAVGSGGGGRSVAMAAGGVLRRATNVVAGEAGPEAFVPLNRPLSQVSPDVRWLSAIAQGKAQPTQTGDGGRHVTFGPGSIVVQGATDSRRTAYDVLDVVAERIAS